MSSFFLLSALFYVMGDCSPGGRGPNSGYSGVSKSSSGPGSRRSSRGKSYPAVFGKYQRGMGDMKKKRNKYKKISKITCFSFFRSWTFDVRATKGSTHKNASA